MNVESIWSPKRWAIWIFAAVAVYVLYVGAGGGFNGRSTPSSLNLDASGGRSHSDTAAPANSHQSDRPDPPRNIDGEFYDALTTEQCYHHFPDLYKDIEKRVAYWKERGHTITKDDVDITWRDVPQSALQTNGGAFRILLHDNQLRIIESIGTFKEMGYHERGLATLGMLQRALNSAIAVGEQLPSIEVALLVDDVANPPNEEGTHSFWTYAEMQAAQSHKRRWLVPSYNLLYGTPGGSFKDSRREAKQHDAPFAAKLPQVVWRGNPLFNQARTSLIDVTRGKDWADVKSVTFFDPSSAVYRLRADEYCRYAMVIHTEGISYSGRLNHLLNCNSLPFIHELNWVTYWQHLLHAEGPEQNYVFVNSTWADLEEKVQYYLTHPDEAEKIIANSIATFRGKYLTQAAESCYLRELIKGYASVAFQPDLHRPEQGDGIKRLRGISYEVFNDYPTDLNETAFYDWELGIRYTPQA